MNVKIRIAQNLEILFVFQLLFNGKGYFASKGIILFGKNHKYHIAKHKVRSVNYFSEAHEGDKVC